MNREGYTCDTAQGRIPRMRGDEPKWGTGALNISPSRITNKEWKDENLKIEIKKQLKEKGINKIEWK